MNLTLCASRIGVWALALLLLLLPAEAEPAQAEEANKAQARRFYEQVWFSRNLAAVDELVAEHYIVHDIGDRKALREPASEQALTAERFWRNGAMGGHIDFQIAEGDLVATRWHWEYAPRTWWARALMLGGRESVPIINVFRFQEGRIVEIWNHRHDIDIGFAANLLRLQGIAIGVLATVLVGAGVRVVRRRRNRQILDEVADVPELTDPGPKVGEGPNR